jgi:hypothetical protein
MCELCQLSRSSSVMWGESDAKWVANGNSSGRPAREVDTVTSSLLQLQLWWAVPDCVPLVSGGPCAA